jgi:hypothetical protein
VQSLICPVQALGAIAAFGAISHLSATLVNFSSSSMPHFRRLLPCFGGFSFRFFFFFLVHSLSALSEDALTEALLFLLFVLLPEGGQFSVRVWDLLTGSATHLQHFS